MLDRTGVLAAVLAYTAWGFFPIYWQFLKQISALETMSHRVIWSLAFYTGIAGVRGSLREFPGFFADRAQIKRVALGSVFIAVNWLLYVWSVTHGHVMETSLGYFINPLLNVAIGAIVLKEPLSRRQKISLVFAGAGVLWLTIDYGRPPWIALGLAGSFAIYGWIKKSVKGDATVISMVETSVLLPFGVAAATLIRLYGTGSGYSLIETPVTLATSEWLLLIFGGAITGIPLLLFGVAAQRLPLSTLGFFQYLAPSFQFLSAVLFFHEPLSQSRLIGFGFIWLALGVFIAGLRKSAR